MRLHELGCGPTLTCRYSRSGQQKRGRSGQGVGGGRSGGRRDGGNGNGAAIEQYVHHSMVADPWAALEERRQQLLRAGHFPPT